MGGLLSAFGAAFGASAALAISAAVAWGILSVLLSPCHLSSVPLVVAYMSGGDDLPSGRRALGIASAFALGILASVGVVGAVTASAGRILGDVGKGGTWVVAGVFFAVGLNLLGVLPLPSFSVMPERVRRRGAFGALGLGLVFGVALGPCTFAFMAPLLAVALRASGASTIAYGALLVAAYGLGHAITIALMGSSVQTVNSWLGWKAGARAAALVKQLAGAAVLAAGGYFLWTAW